MLLFQLCREKRFNRNSLKTLFDITGIPKDSQLRCTIRSAGVLVLSANSPQLALLHVSLAPCTPPLRLSKPFEHVSKNSCKGTLMIDFIFSFSHCCRIILFYKCMNAFEMRMKAQIIAEITE